VDREDSCSRRTNRNRERVSGGVACGGIRQPGETVNAKQKWVLEAGVVIAVLIGLYPPWQFVVHRGPWEVPRQGPYGFLFGPPHATAKTENGLVVDAVTGWPMSSEETRLDTQRLAVEWITLIFVVSGLLLLFRSPSGTPPASTSTQPPAPTAQPGRGSTVPPQPQTPLQKPQPEGRPYRPFRPEGQHWVVDALEDHRADLDLSVDLELESLGDLDQVQDPYLAFDLLGPQNPHFPYWLPKAYQGRELTFHERREWFDELMRFYGGYSNDSQVPVEPSSRQRLAVQCLFLMYQGEIMGTLPAPKSTRQEDH
jgi:hypothetical protein